ncbi:MAG: NADP-dependent oxidoreductase [Betaproteobacteria bacterium]|nr:NADP-dependent oxidoreductase [Betaproteobacteria bacterium]
MAKMKAIRFASFGGPEVLRLEEVAAPAPPGPHEVLIAIEAACVTPGDWKLRAGQLQTMFPVSLPCIPGRDGAGRITAIGKAVDYAQPGDAVCFVAERTVQGSYAESIVRDAASIVALPPRLSFAEGAALMHAGTCAWIALVDTAHIARGQKILIHAGAGAIGGMAIQIAKHIGAYVATICSARNAPYARGLGADLVIEYDREDFAEKLLGYDVVLDLVGGEAHEQSYRVLNKGGVMVWLIARPIVDRSAEYGVRTLQAHIQDDPRALAGVIDLARRGVLKPQVSRIMPLSAAADAQRRVQAGDNSRGRIVLDVRGRASEVV